MDLKCVAVRLNLTLKWKFTHQRKLCHPHLISDSEKWISVILWLMSAAFQQKFASVFSRFKPHRAHMNK